MKPEEVLLLATKAAKKLNLQLKDKKKILRGMIGEHPTTAFSYDDNSILWIDRHYIAYSADTSIDIIYLYISRKHVADGLASIRTILRKEINLQWYVQLTNEVAQMREALSEMNRNDKDFYVFEKNLSRLMGGTL